MGDRYKYKMTHALQNIDNYKANFDCGTSEIFAKYLGLVTEYLIQCAEGIYIRNPVYYRYILCKGIDTITHVFRLLLLYTKNLNLTYHHCQKSFYYYVEFIGQIGDDNHSFLQLNSKDASLFVYKKTIFDINNEYRKEFGSELAGNQIMTNIDRLMGIYNRSLCLAIQTQECDPENKSVLITETEKVVGKLSQNLLNLALAGDESVYGDKLLLLEHLEKRLDSQDTSGIPIIETLARKLRKKKFSIEELNTKLGNDQFQELRASYTPLRFANWLLTPC